MHYYQQQEQQKKLQQLNITINNLLLTIFLLIIFFPIFLIITPFLLKMLNYLWINGYFWKLWNTWKNLNFGMGAVHKQCRQDFDPPDSPPPYTSLLPKIMWYHIYRKLFNRSTSLNRGMFWIEARKKVTSQNFYYIKFHNSWIEARSKIRKLNRSTCFY